MFSSFLFNMFGQFISFILFIHQVPPKYNGSTPSKELLDSNLAIFSSTPSVIPNVMKNLTSTWKANYGKNSMASNLNYHTAEGFENVHFNSVPPKSSQTAMKILEHLNKTIPSPKEKLIHANPEVVETKSFSKFATGCHAKKPVDVEKAKASLFSKGVAEEEKVYFVFQSIICLTNLFLCPSL